MISKPSAVYLPPELDGKAKNLCARMAIYFDNNIYNEPDKRNDTLLYTYMYNIIMMLAKTKKLFRKQKEYEDFASYMSTKLYLRYINPEHTKKCGKIKSVRNYCDNLIKPTKVDFQRETFDEIFGVNNKGQKDGTGEILRQSMESSVQGGYCKDHNLIEVMLDEIESLPSIISKVVSEAHFKKDSEMYHRLYMSTLISILNSLTLNNSSLKKLKGREQKGYDNEKFMLDLYRKESENCVILWRLEESFKGLVSLLVNKTRIRIVTQLASSKHDLELDQEDLNAVIMSAYGNVLRDNNEEV